MMHYSDMYDEALRVQRHLALAGYETKIKAIAVVFDEPKVDELIYFVVGKGILLLINQDTLRFENDLYLHGLHLEEWEEKSFGKIVSSEELEEVYPTIDFDFLCIDDIQEAIWKAMRLVGAIETPEIVMCRSECKFIDFYLYTYYYDRICGIRDLNLEEDIKLISISE